MAMKKLYTCGCSMMSVDKTPSNIISFLELYARTKNLEHISLARSGATNFLICLQLDYAIQQNPDYIIVGATSSDRLDLSIMNQTLHTPITIDNVDYSGHNSLSENLFADDTPIVVSNTLNNFVENLQKEDISIEQRESVKYYLTNLHCNMLQLQKDALMIRGQLAKLIKSNIPFLFLPGPMHWMQWSDIPNVWPSEYSQPWDLPYGTANSISHNPQKAHDEFAKNLLKLDWNG